MEVTEERLRTLFIWGSDGAAVMNCETDGGDYLICQVNRKIENDEVVQEMLFIPRAFAIELGDIAREFEGDGTP